VLTLGATAFHHEIKDLISAVTVSRGAGTDPRFDLIGDGGVGRQRTNLELARVQGLEFSVRWVPWRELTLTGSAVWQDAEVRRAPTAPALVGKWLRQVPREYALMGASWQAPAALRITPRIRYLGRQYTDEENLRPLGRTFVVDLGVSRALNKNVEIYLSVENVGDARIETGRSGVKVIRIGAPRLAVGGLRGSW
jgi:outer membrane receptor protein involved in Fe transport